MTPTITPGQGWSRSPHAGVFACWVCWVCWVRGLGLLVGVLACFKGCSGVFGRGVGVCGCGYGGMAAATGRSGIIATYDSARPFGDRIADPLVEPPACVHPRRHGRPDAAESVRGCDPTRPLWPGQRPDIRHGRPLPADRHVPDGDDRGVRRRCSLYIDIDLLVELWDDLWLSPYVREAWSAWLHDRGLIDDPAGC